ncbi:PaaI family thioesterase [Amycolatopsis pigmentata]|uniref:PaaI family thioesterase n=1 Tax=Amycolatopsis pigmentata TaxID=450801 RepID=A0ABW5FNW6_9PSEU
MTTTNQHPGEDLPDLERRIPSEYRPLAQEGFLGYLGGIWVRQADGCVDTCLLIAADHLNPNGTVHGGVLLSLLDYTLGATAEAALGQGTGRHPATISLTTHFLAAADRRDLLFGTAQVLRRTRTLSFVEGQVSSGGRPVASASAVFRNPALA